MAETKNYNIEDIEALTEAEAVAMALEKLDIKGYNVYLWTSPATSATAV